MTNRVTWGEGSYAGFWLRVGGFLIDLLLVGAVTSVVFLGVFALGLATTATAPGDSTPPGAIVLFVVLWIAGAAPYFLYDTIMTSRFGWTLGKRAVGIEVRRADGELLSFLQAVGRYFGRILSSIPLYLGYFWAAWDPRKQTWHDKLVNCYVVQSARLGPADAPSAPQAVRPWGGYSGWGIPAGQRPGAFQQAGAPPAPAAAWGAPGQPGGGGEGREQAWGRPAEDAPAEPAREAAWGRPAEDAPAEPARAEEWGRPVGGTLEAPTGGEPPGHDERGAPAEDPGEAAPPQGQDEPVATAWAQELDAASGQSPPPSALEGDSLESARWTGAAATEAGSPDPWRPAQPQEEPWEQPPGEPGEDAPGQPRQWSEAVGEQPAAEGSADGRAEQEAREEGARAAPEASMPPVPGRASDPNVVGIGRAGIPGESAAWLEQVADQVDSRLDRVAPQWRSSPQAEAARACAFGLLLGHLATIYPHMTDDLARVAEAHPSFSTLAEGSRLATLQQIVADPRRAAAWLGPLIGAEDPEQVQRLLD